MDVNCEHPHFRNQDLGYFLFDRERQFASCFSELASLLI